jgi:hypothetical protein
MKERMRFAPADIERFALGKQLSGNRYNPTTLIHHLPGAGKLG